MQCAACLPHQHTHACSPLAAPAHLPQMWRSLARQRPTTAGDFMHASFSRSGICLPALSACCCAVCAHPARLLLPCASCAPCSMLSSCMERPKPPAGCCPWAGTDTPALASPPLQQSPHHRAQVRVGQRCHAPAAKLLGADPESAAPAAVRKPTPSASGRARPAARVGPQVLALVQHVQVGDADRRCRPGRRTRVSPRRRVGRRVCVGGRAGRGAPRPSGRTSAGSSSARSARHGVAAWQLRYTSEYC